MKTLFPPDPAFEKFNDTCFLEWKRETCELCLRRTDIPTLTLAGYLRPWSPDPTLRIPSVFLERLKEEADKISPAKVWRSLLRDHDLDTVECALCAGAPDVYARLIRRLVAAPQNLTGERFWRWTLEVREHYLALSEDEKRIVYRYWETLSKKEQLESRERNEETFLFLLIFPDWSPSEQLSYLLQRSEEAGDPELCEIFFRPFAGAPQIETLLDEAGRSIDVRRLIWFHGFHQRILSPDTFNAISRFGCHEDSVTRMVVLRLLYRSRSSTPHDVLKEGGWRASRDGLLSENHWGSMLLADRGRHMSLSDLARRIDPLYLGFAVEKRGLLAEEVRWYAEKLHEIWTGIEGPPLENVPRAGLVAHVESQEPEFSRLGAMFEADYLMQYVNPYAYWGRPVNDRVPHGDRLQRFFSGEDIQDRDRLLEEEFNRQRRLGNVWFGRIFFTNALPQVVQLRWDLVEQWLAGSRDKLLMASTFYEGLCDVLLRQSLKGGFELYWRLKREPLPVQITANGIERLDYFLFKTPSTKEAREEWGRRLDYCRTDQQLLELVLVAEHGNGAAWLWNLCQEDLSSGIVKRRARALILLGFSSVSTALDILEAHAAQRPECWLTRVADKALDNWRRNQWAQHQYSRFLAAEDDIHAWAAFRLLLLCVDRRFWRWLPRFEDLSPELPGFKRRRAFFENNRDTLRNRIQNNEKQLAKSFLGTKVLEGEVHPWLE
ncbi:MAG TPA: hypothetical protein VGG06_25345 [Thermoanaerobaculia bacterium]